MTTTTALAGPASARDFRAQMLTLFYRDVHQFEANNYAWERYSADGVDRSQTLDLIKHASALMWFMDNTERIFNALTLLADQTSRDLYVDLLRFRLAGHLHVRIGTRVHSLADDVRRFRETFVGVPSELPSAGDFGNLLHYDAVWNGVRYTVDTLRDALVWPLVYGHYAFQRDGVSVAPRPGDHVIDGGACTGDSACVFSRWVGPAGRVYAFDPVENHLAICRHNFARAGYDNVRLFGSGISDRRVEGAPIQLGRYNPGWNVGMGQVPLCRIDDLVMSGEIERVDFIKMDVEGSEMPALRGALASIHRFRPRLAISTYHRPDDFFEIIEFVHGLNLGYRLYLDHHAIYDEETVLYALPA